ncbi:MAG TPA: hypothetical protein VFA71_06405 [Terriglobales bacterium]|nr:hypothetical protein [Terriglobales bacterium]
MLSLLRLTATQAFIAITATKLYKSAFNELKSNRDRREKMRSDLIFGALRPVRNRYTLCQLAAQATRKFHKPNSRIQETMNDVLVRFSKASSAERVMHGSGSLENKLARSQRQAA